MAAVPVPMQGGGDLSMTPAFGETSREHPSRREQRLFKDRRSIYHLPFHKLHSLPPHSTANKSYYPPSDPRRLGEEIHIKEIYYVAKLRRSYYYVTWEFVYFLIEGVGRQSELKNNS